MPTGICYSDPCGLYTQTKIKNSEICGCMRTGRKKVNNEGENELSIPPFLRNM